MAVVTFVLGVSCSSGPTTEEQLQRRLVAYFEAVHSEDERGLFTLLAECQDVAARLGEASARESCGRTLAGLVESVGAQRAEGHYLFDDPWGFGLVIALVLGRGGFYVVDLVEESEREAVALVRVRTQYVQHETKNLPRGAVIEYLVEPLGAVHRLARGEDTPGGLRKQLDALDLEASFVRLSGTDGRDEWRLVSLRPLPETATFTEVMWRPL